MRMTFVERFLFESRRAQRNRVGVEIRVEESCRGEEGPCEVGFERGVCRVVQYTIRRKSPEPRTADAEWNVVVTRAQRSGKVERESESVEN